MKKMKGFSLLLALTMGAFAINAQALIVSKVVSVYDGDTLRVDIDGFPDLIGKNMPVRIMGIDTPEIRGQCVQEKRLAIQARDFLRDALKNGDTVELLDPTRGKYFRLLAAVTIDGKPVSEAMIKAGLARPYDGGKRESWCEE